MFDIDENGCWIARNNWNEMQRIGRARRKAERLATA